MESWSGAMEWHVGMKFWSGMKSDFEFFVAHLFHHNPITHDCHYQDTNFKNPTALYNLWSGVMKYMYGTAKGF